MDIQLEQFEDVLLDIPALWKAHYLEIADDKDKKTLSPDISNYLALEQSNRLAIFTARDKGELVGYAFFVVNASLHYKRHLVAQNDLFFVLPSYRGRFVGGQLIDAAETLLKNAGVNEIQMRAKVNHDFGPLLKRKGFKETEIVYRKHIGVANG